MSRAFHFLVLGMLLGGSAHAIVDSSTGAFTHSWIDYEGKDLDLEMKLERTYNSRSNHRGWFGYGWCSDLETSLNIQDKEIVLNHCGDGGQIRFTKSGNAFRAGGDDGVIQKVGNTYTRTFKDGTVETFSSTGRLQEVKKNQEFIALKYDEKSRPRELTDSAGKVVKISTTAEGFVSEIQFIGKKPDGSPLKETVGKYSYKGEDLVSAVNFWGNTYTYEYDKGHNLVRANWPEGKSIQLTYNTNDWVKSLNGSEICAENYDYKVDTAKSSRYSVNVTKKCDGGVIYERSYTYTYSDDKKRTVAAEREDDHSNREFKYDKNNNVIEVIERRQKNTIVTKIDRNDRGQIIKVSNQFESRSYKYKSGTSKDLVAEVVYDIMVMGKLYSSDKYLFGYDKDDRLISAIKPDGTKLSFKFDSQSRLSQVATAKDSIEIIYEEGKPDAQKFRWGGKTLPLNAMSELTDEERTISELYYDFIRMMDLTVPSY